MRPKIADNSYNGYKNVVYNYVTPQLGKMYMATLNQGYNRKLIIRLQRNMSLLHVWRKQS